MTTQEQYIERLCEMVEQKFGRSISTAEDCDALAQAVGEETNTKLDTRAYVILFVNKSRTAIRPITLSTLTRYIGYESWGSFCTSDDIRPATDTDLIPTTRRWGVIILTLVAILTVIGATIFLLVDNNDQPIDYEQAKICIDNIEDRWLARTIEECNALREFNADPNYTMIVDNFIREYFSTIDAEIAADLGEVALNDNQIEIETERIVAKCHAMCECLYTEMN
jgi:hypothetical protein